MSFARYPAYKDSGVEWLGEVPDGWRVQRLKRIAAVYPSNVDKKSYDDEVPVLLCNYTDVYYNERIDRRIEFMAASASPEQIRKFSLKAGDVLITKDSETANDIAIAAHVPEDLPGVVCGYHLAVVRSLSGAHGAFVKRLFDCQYAKASFAVLANGLTRMGLGQYALDNVGMPIPPLPEQHAIATFLDSETAKIDSLITEQQKLMALLKEKRQAVISHAVTKGLDPNVPMKDSGVEWLGEVPEGWGIWKLPYAFQVIGSGTTPKSDNAAYYEDGTIAWLNTGDLNDGALFASEKHVTPLAIKECSALKLYPPGALVIAMYGATIGKLGLLRFATTVNQACCVFAGEIVVSTEFLFYWFLGARQHIVSMATGGGQPNISQEVLRALRVPCPRADEQHAIATFLDSETAKIDTLVTESDSAITLLKERRSALISAAVTGKIDVRGLVALEAA